MSGLKIKIKFGGGGAQQPSQHPSASAEAPPDTLPPASGAASGTVSDKPRKKKKKKRQHDDTLQAASPHGMHQPHVPGAAPQQSGSSGPLRISFKGSWLQGGSKVSSDTASEQPKKKRKKHKEDKPLTIRLPAKPSAPSTAGWDHQLAAAAAQAAVAGVQSGSHLGAYRPSGGFGALTPKQAKAKQPKPPPAAAEPRTSSRKKRKVPSAYSDGQSPAELDSLASPDAGYSGQAPKVNTSSAAAVADASAADANVTQVKVEVMEDVVKEEVKEEGVEERPEVPLTQEAVERVINKVQKKDVFQIFKDPVTDEVAPGYSAAIKRPMDFTTMRKRFGDAMYSSWELLQDDMRTMFTNAMTFNPPDSLYHKQASTLMGLADKLISLARRGIKDMRGRTASVVRAHTAQISAQVKLERDAARAAEKAEKAAVAQASKLGEEGGSGGQPTAPRAASRIGRPVTRLPKELIAPPPVDETVRNTYPGRCRDASLLTLRGLACGANAEGVAYGRQALVPLQASSVTAAYVKHLTAFLAGLKGRMATAGEAILAQYIATPKPAVAATPQPVQPIQPPAPVAAWQTAQPAVTAAAQPVSQAVTAPLPAAPPAAQPSSQSNVTMWPQAANSVPTHQLAVSSVALQPSQATAAAVRPAVSQSALI